MKHPEDWKAIFGACGFDEVELCSLSGQLDNADILIATRPQNSELASLDHEEQHLDDTPEPKKERERKVIIATTVDCESENEFKDSLSKELIANGVAHDTIMSLSPYGAKKQNGAKASWPKLLPTIDDSAGRDIDIIHLIGALEKPTDCLPADSMKELSKRAKNITNLLQTLGARKARLWIVAPGGARAITMSGTPSPVQSGIWAYGRTAMNEYGDLDIRLIDFEEGLKSEECAQRLATLLSSPGDETELVLTKNGMQALRVRRGLPASPANSGETKKATAITLSHPTSGSLDQMKWMPAKRSTLKDEEVEIAVVATGLNFRDVMWAQGLLPEEALEDGFAGPTLGFECSGKITSIGKKVSGLKVGDRVMALAPACFASHVTVSQTAVSKLPSGTDLTAAATIPVAFLTAYYALHHLAHLEEGEWVLIHGAAGGVGLAALQVAKWRRAKVIATAGSDEKRSFLKMLGADHVLNTRSLDFVDQVRAITVDEYGDGVDVVLNSLVWRSDGTQH